MPTIADKVSDAFNKYRHSESAYTQALIFVLEIQVEAYQESAKVKKSCDDFEVEANKIGLSGREYFRCATFFSLISAMEVFFQELLKAVIREYPKKIGSTQFKLSEILEIGSEEELIDKAIDEYLNKVMYKKPNEYLVEICDLLSIDSAAIYPIWPTFVEAKARRDVGIHNNWICNETYLRKCMEAKFNTNSKIGDKLIPSNKDYIFNTSKHMRAIATDLAKQVIAKHS